MIETDIVWECDRKLKTPKERLQQIVEDMPWKDTRDGMVERRRYLAVLRDEIDAVDACIGDRLLACEKDPLYRIKERILKRVPEALITDLESVVREFSEKQPETLEEKRAAWDKWCKERSPKPFCEMLIEEPYDANRWLEYIDASAPLHEWAVQVVVPLCKERLALLQNQ